MTPTDIDTFLITLDMFWLSLWSILCFLLGILSFRIYQSRLIRYLPEQGNLDLHIFFAENAFIIEDEQEVRLPSPEQSLHRRLILTLENKDKEDIHLESWSVRVLNAQGFLRQIFLYPQNLVHTLRPGEKKNVEINSLNFLSGKSLFTVVVRDIYGREWNVNKQEIEVLRKDFFWQNL